MQVAVKEKFLAIGGSHKEKCLNKPKQYKKVKHFFPVDL